MSDTNPYEYSEASGGERYPDLVRFDDAEGYIEFQPEKFFGRRQILLFTCVALPIGMSFGIIIGLLLLTPLFFIITQNWNAVTLGIVLLIPSLFAFYFMPWWAYPNCFIVRIIARFHELPITEGQSICQFSTCPPRYGKLHVLFEDTDDLGILELKTNHLVFEGDHTTAIIPYSSIASVCLKNAGFNKSLWLGYYLRIYFFQDDAQEFQYIQIGDRATKTLLGSYRAINELRKKIKVKINPF